MLLGRLAVQGATKAFPVVIVAHVVKSGGQYILVRNILLARTVEYIDDRTAQTLGQLVGAFGVPMG